MTSGPPGETESDIPAWVNAPAEPPEPAEPAPGVRTGPRRRVIHESALEGLELRGEPRHRKRQGSATRKLLVIGGAVFIGLLLVVVIALFWVNGHLGGKGGAAVQVTLPDQASHATLTADLTKAHVVKDGWLFHHYLDYRGTGAVVAGTYTFHLHEGYRAALHDLAQGPQVQETRFTIPEGYDLKQIAAKVGTLPGLSAQRFLDLANSGAVHSPYQPAGSNNLEGLLFPDTYFVNSADTEQTILQRMTDRFTQVAGSLGMGPDTTLLPNGLTSYQTIVAASLVEKEAKIDADRGKIARVIENRLTAGMKLQIDATVEYAEGVHKDRLLDSDLKTQSPYNTYLIAGLPPGPIAGPGKASLQAALQPTPGTWLYYVLIDPSGAHGFATTASEFARLEEEAHAKGLR